MGGQWWDLPVRQKLKINPCRANHTKPTKKKTNKKRTNPTKQIKHTKKKQTKPKKSHNIKKKPVHIHTATHTLKHRTNCECCPGHYPIVDHYSSMSRFKFRNLSAIVNLVTNSLNRSQSKSKSKSLSLL